MIVQGSKFNFHGIKKYKHDYGILYSLKGYCVLFGTILSRKINFSGEKSHEKFEKFEGPSRPQHSCGKQNFIVGFLRFANESVRLQIKRGSAYLRIVLKGQCVYRYENPAVDLNQQFRTTAGLHPQPPETRTISSLNRRFSFSIPTLD